MKRLAALILLLFALSLSPAQTGDELIELDTAALSESAWQDHLQALLDLDLPLKLDSRLLWDQESIVSLHSSLYQAESASLLLNARRDWDKRQTFLSGNTRIRTRTLDAMLGAWRFRFGRGLLLGSGGRSLPDSLFSLQYPGSAASYTPLGAVVKLSRGAWRGGVFGSLQERETRLKDGQISSLPQTRTGLLTATPESIFGATLGWQQKQFQTALLAYHQSYGKDFAASLDLQRRITAGSLFASLDLGAHSLDGEAALLDGDLAALLTWQYRSKGFRQTLSYAHNGFGPKQLPYALQPAVLNTAAGRDEYSLDLQLALPLNTSVLLRYSLNSGASFSADPLSRLVAALSYKQAGNTLKLSYYSFDRQIITLVDSSYLPLSPRNHRLELHGKYFLRSNVYQELEFSYSLEDKADYRKNTYRAGLYWSFEQGKLRLKAGFLTWQSPRSFIALDGESPDYYSVCTADDNLIVATAAYARKRLQFSVSGRKSLLHPGKFELRLRLGLSLL